MSVGIRSANSEDGSNDAGHGPTTLPAPDPSYRSDGGREAIVYMVTGVDPAYIEVYPRNAAPDLPNVPEEVPADRCYALCTPNYGALYARAEEAGAQGKRAVREQDDIVTMAEELFIGLPQNREARDPSPVDSEEALDRVADALAGEVESLSAGTLARRE